VHSSGKLSAKWFVSEMSSYFRHSSRLGVHSVSLGGRGVQHHAHYATLAVIPMKVYINVPAIVAQNGSL